MRKRILLVDDNAEIHEDYRKILDKSEKNSLDAEEKILFGFVKTPATSRHPGYRLDSAFQGEEALEFVKKSLLENDPYALAFIDMRMPPGWNGVETIRRIWEIDPSVQMVICSAYSDHSWEDITRILENSDNLLILKKPFEVIEINQLAAALTKKWELIADLNRLVQNRTFALENLQSLTQATLESTEEGIFATGFDENILTYNKKFLQQWQLKQEQLEGANSNTIFQHLANQVDDSNLFLKNLLSLIEKPCLKNSKEWQLKNGKIFTLYAQPQYLHEQIIGMVFSFQDISERKKLEQQLFHQATHDILTGLPNRALLLDRMNQAIANARRFNLKVGTIVLDLDAFKEINDSLGHSAGDMLLKQTAKKLKEFVRENDTVARIGGDEFVIILEAQLDEKKCLVFVERLVELFSTPCKLEDHEIIVTASIGLSIFPQDGDQADILLKNADSALFYAKEQGRNRFQCYKEEFKSHILEQAELKVALAQALAKNQLSLHYQPLVNLATGQIIGVEALLRWNHPTMGMIPPLTFISAAEDSGQIVAIGEWVLRTACTQLKIWQKSSAFPGLKISVNISVKQFRQKNFVDMVRNLLHEIELDPGFLELEITETLILGNVADVIHKMVELKAIGVRFAIDDFGTGYSSLSYLKHFPFDTVKIDKSFMDNINTDSNNASIVEAIIGMTKNMGIDVLAEGVEYLEQVDFLREHHGNQVQGYYFSKPLDVTDCTELLNTKLLLF